VGRPVATGGEHGMSKKYQILWCWKFGIRPFGFRWYKPEGIGLIYMWVLALGFVEIWRWRKDYDRR
jgi:hypothetical protein